MVHTGNDNILDLFKLRPFADDKLNVAKMTISLFDRTDNTAEKKNAGCQYFLLFPTEFSKVFFFSVIKVSKL